MRLKRLRQVGIILITAAFSLVSLVSCSSKPNPTSSSSSSQAAVSTEKKILTVSVTLSKDFLKGIDSLSSSLGSTSSAETSSKLPDGVLKIVKNADGSETITMTKAKHTEMLKEIKKSVMDAIEKLKTSSSSETSFIDITANDKLNDFRVTVNKEQFTNSLEGISLLGIYLAGGLYQEFNNISEPTAIFHMIDSTTKKEFKTIKFPDDLAKNSVSSSSNQSTTATKKATASRTKTSSIVSTHSIDSAHKNQLHTEGWDSAKKAGRTDGYKDGYQDMLDGSATNTTIGPSYLHSYRVPDGEEQSFYDGYSEGYDYWYHMGYAEGMDQSSIDKKPKRDNPEAPSMDNSQRGAGNMDVDGAIDRMNG